MHLIVLCKSLGTPDNNYWLTLLKNTTFQKTLMPLYFHVWQGIPQSCVASTGTGKLVKTEEYLLLVPPNISRLLRIMVKQDSDPKHCSDVLKF